MLLDPAKILAFCSTRLFADTALPYREICLPPIADINRWHQSPIRPDIESVPAQLVGAEMVPAPAQDQVVAALCTDGRHWWPYVVFLDFHDLLSKEPPDDRRSQRARGDAPACSFVILIVA